MRDVSYVFQVFQLNAVATCCIWLDGLQPCTRSAAHPFQLLYRITKTRICFNCVSCILEEAHLTQGCVKTCVSGLPAYGWHIALGLQAAWAVSNHATLPVLCATPLISHKDLYRMQV